MGNVTKALGAPNKCVLNVYKCTVGHMNWSGRFNAFHLGQAWLLEDKDKNWNDVWAHKTHNMLLKLEEATKIIF